MLAKSAVRFMAKRTALFLTLFVFFGSAKSSPAQGPLRPQPATRTKLLVWGLELGKDSEGLAAQIREFERLNPDIEVSALSMGAGEMNPQKLMTSIVGGVPPDIIE